jgi:hypothetical protein
MPESPIQRTTFERLLHPLVRELTPEMAHALLRVRADEEVVRRHEYLADRITEGQLTAEEADELVQIVNANLMVSVLKAEAQAYLRHAA